MFFESDSENEERGGAIMVARSFIAEAHNITDVFEIISGLLDGPASANMTHNRMWDPNPQIRAEERDRIQRRYMEKIGEPLLLRHAGQPCKLGKGKIAVLAKSYPQGPKFYGIVVSDLVIDNRLVYQMWEGRKSYTPLDKPPNGVTRVVDTRFGEIEVAVPKVEINWPQAAPADGRRDTEAWIFKRSPELEGWHFQ